MPFLCLVHLPSVCMVIMIALERHTTLTNRRAKLWWLPTHTSLVCLSSISGLWERNTLRFCKQTRIGGTHDLCYIYRQSVRNGQVASVSASAPFPQRGECPQVIYVCQMYQSRECGLMIEFVYCLNRRMEEESLVGTWKARSKHWVELVSYGCSKTQSPSVSYLFLRTVSRFCGYFLSVFHRFKYCIPSF